MSSKETCTQFESYTSANGRILIQPNGCGGQVFYLPCHGADTLDQQLGSSEPALCWDHSNRRLVPYGSVQSEQGGVTATVNFYTSDVVQRLQDIDCPFNLYFLFGECPPGKLDDINTFEWGYRLDNSRVTGRIHNNLAALDTVAPSTIGASISAELQIIFKRLDVSVQLLPGAPRLFGVSFVSGDKCSTGPCAELTRPCEIGFAVGDTGEVFRNLDGTWERTPTDPGGGGLTLRESLAVDLGNGNVRIFAAEFVVGAGDSLHYSDNLGVTWTELAEPWGANVHLNLTQAPYNQNLHQDSSGNLWVITEPGTIFKSDDFGLTWTQKYDGAAFVGAPPVAGHVITSNAGIMIAAGKNDVFLISFDRGETWTETTVTGSAANVVYSGTVTPDQTIWLGAGDPAIGPRLYKSIDKGRTFVEVPFEGAGSISLAGIVDIKFPEKCCGFMLFSAPGDQSFMNRTLDGGQTWERIPDSTGSLALAMNVCNCDLAYVATIDGQIGKVFARTA